MDIIIGLSVKDSDLVSFSVASCNIHTVWVTFTVVVVVVGGLHPEEGAVVVVVVAAGLDLLDPEVL